VLELYFWIHRRKRGKKKKRKKKEEKHTHTPFSFSLDQSVAISLIFDENWKSLFIHDSLCVNWFIETYRSSKIFCPLTGITKRSSSFSHSNSSSSDLILWESCLHYFHPGKYKSDKFHRHTNCNSFTVRVTYLTNHPVSPWRTVSFHRQSTDTRRLSVQDSSLLRGFN